MTIKSLLSTALDNELNQTRPESLKHWWKFDTEKTGDKTLIDVIGGANITWEGVPNLTVTDGLVSLSGALVGILLEKEMEAIGTKDFMFVIGGNSSSAFSKMNFSDDGTHEFDIINTGGNSRIVGADGTTSILSAGFPSAGTGAFSISRKSDGDENAIYVNGSVDNAPVADGAGSINAFTTLGNWHQALKESGGMALFIYDDGLPVDAHKGAWFMGQSWRENNKVIWPNIDKGW